MLSSKEGLLMRLILIAALIALAACSPRPLSSMEQVDQESLKFMQQRYQAEAKRIQHVSREGQTLSIKADNGKVVSFTDNNPCVGFECSLYDFQGMYADGQFYRLNHIHSEFFFPDYLISRKTGTVTDMIGPLEEKNLSPNKQFIATAVGGDAGPSGAIHLWQITDGELVSVVAHSFPEYGNWTLIGWNAESTAVSFSKLGYYKECPDASNRPSWGTSDLALQKQDRGWAIVESNIQCREPNFQRFSLRNSSPHSSNISSERFDSAPLPPTITY